MKKIKDKKIYIILGVVVAFFGLLIKMNYSVDTYLIFSSPKMSYIKEFIQNGRIFTYIFLFLLGTLKVTPNIIYLLSYTMAIILLTKSIYELNKIISIYVHNEMLSILFSLVILINPFMIELWLFLETGIMMLSIFAIVRAFKYFDLYLKDRNRNSIIYVLLWNMIAIFSYQGTFALFMILATFSIIMNCKNKRGFIKDSLFALISYSIPAFINYLFIIVLSTERVNTVLDAGKIFRNIIFSTVQIINGFGLFFKEFTMLFLIISVILTIYFILNSESKNKKNLLFYVFYIILITYIFTILPIIPQSGDRVAIYPRTCYAFFSIIGILFLLINKKSNSKIISYLLVVFLMVEFLTFTRLEINRFRVNELDKEIILKIEDKVKDYENRTKISVNKLAVYNLSDSQKFYNELNDGINVSAIKEEPSGIAIYTYYTNRFLSYTDSDEIVFNNYFKNLDSNSFSLDQVVIIDDTIHWYLY